MIPQAWQTKLYADSYSLTVMLFQRSKAIPRAHRPTIGRGLEESTLKILFAVRAAGVASESIHKHSFCLQASDSLDRLRIIAQISKDLGFFSEAVYFEISEKSAEIGKQLGGWLKKTQILAGPHEK